MRWTSSTLALALSMVLAQAALAGEACGPVQESCGKECCGSENCCGRCGKHCGGCGMSCKVVCYMKQVPKTVFKVEEKPICISLPGCPADKCGGNGCAEGKCGESCGNGGCSAEKCGLGGTIVPPKCGCARCVKVLTCKTVICEVPCYKCVPCYACGECYNACEQEAAAAKAQIQAAPAPQTVPAPPAPKAPAPKPAKAAMNYGPDVR